MIVCALCLSFTLAGGGCRLISASADAAQARTREPAGPPPMIAVELAPLRGDAINRAQTPLAEVLKLLPQPSFLAGSTEDATPTTTPSQEEQLPPANNLIQRAAGVMALKAYARGRVALQSGDITEAIRQLVLARRLDPHTPEVLQLLGQAYAQLGAVATNASYLQQAEEVLREAIGLTPDHQQSLFWLTQLAYRGERWEETAALARQLSQLQDADDDPLWPYLANHYLGQALLKMGYLEAGAEVLQTTLEINDGNARSTRLMREATVLMRQRPLVLVQIGDAYTRLGRMSEALEAYEQAAELPEVGITTLLPRMIYVLVASSQTNDARDLLLEALSSKQVDPQVLVGLASYLGQHLDDPADLANRLTHLYNEQDRPTHLAIMTASLLPEAQADRFLRDHLQTHPRDLDVLEAWLDRLITTDPARAITITAELLDEQPDHARDYARTLVRNISSGSRLLDAWQSLPSPENSTSLLYLKGMILQGSEQLDAAEQAYRQALEVGDNFLPARLALVELEIGIGDFQAALDLLNQIEIPNDPRQKYLRVVAYEGLGQSDKALELIDDLLAQDPENTEFLLRKASLHRVKGEHRAAEKDLWRILEDHPREEAVYAALFNLYETSLPDQAGFLRLLRQAQSTIPTSRITRLKTAQLLAVQGNIGQAESLLRGLLRENPDSASTRQILVSLLGRADRWDEAERLLQQRLETHPDDGATYQMLGQVARQTGHLDEFLPRYESFLLRQQDSRPKWISLAALYQETERPHEAIEAMRQALAIEASKPVELRVGLAELLSRAKQYDEALAQIDLALQEHPDQAADLHYFRSSIYHAWNQLDRSEQALEATLKENPDHVLANNDLGYFWADRGVRLDEAERMIRKAVEAQPQNAAILDSLGWVLYKKGQYDSAIQALQQAAKLLRLPDPTILDHLGDAQWRAGQAEAAVQSWEQALAIVKRADQPERPDLAQLKQALEAKIAAVEADKPPDVAPVPAE